jgi:C-terminal processing protease CtpA/Prc
MVMPRGAFIRPGLQRRGAVVRVMPPGVAGGGGGADAFDVDDDLGELRDLIERQMDDADMPEAKRREVVGILERMRAARAGHDPLAADPARAHRQMDAFNRDADALRGRMKDLQLPDPGDALPPGPDARLGIEVVEDAEEGVTVLHVIPGARAARLGVEPLDVITRVNGMAVTDARDVRRAVTDAKPPLVIEVTRDGEPVKLEEKVEEPLEDDAPEVEPAPVE